MTMTISVPVFPMRKEIDARRRRRGLALFSRLGAREEHPDAAPLDRYSIEGFEFDFAQARRKPKGPTASPAAPASSAGTSPRG